MNNEYVMRDYILKCLEDSFKNGGISHSAKSKFTRWLMKAPCVIAPKPMQNPITNADRIHAMSVEELAAWIAEHPAVVAYDENNPQHKAWLEWLEKEADA